MWNERARRMRVVRIIVRPPRDERRPPTSERVAGAPHIASTMHLAPGHVVEVPIVDKVQVQTGREDLSNGCNEGVFGLIVEVRANERVGQKMAVSPLFSRPQSDSPCRESARPHASASIGFFKERGHVDNVFFVRTSSLTGGLFGIEDGLHLGVELPESVVIDHLSDIADVVSSASSVARKSRAGIHLLKNAPRGSGVRENEAKAFGSIRVGIRWWYSST